MIAQIKKWVCFVSGVGRVTSWVKFEAACSVLIMCILSVLKPKLGGGCPVQDVIG